MIGLITYNKDTYSNPTLYELLFRLNLLGKKVTIFSPYQTYHIPKHFDNTGQFVINHSFIKPKRPIRRIAYLISFIKTVLFFKQNGIKNLLAIDPVGLLWAGRLKRVLRSINIHYCSFEIFFEDEFGSDIFLKVIREDEIKTINQVKSLLIQDEYRKALLIAELRIKSEKINWFLIPVAPIPHRSIPEKVDYRKELGLSETAVVYLYSGTIQAWSGVSDVIDAIKQGLPENTFILVHNRYGFDENDVHHSELIRLQQEGFPVILHGKHFDIEEELHSFVECFDYGIVIYRPDQIGVTGKNIVAIGLASGKFSSYMMAGLPSLLIACTTYEEILKRYPVGELITDVKTLHYHIINNTLATIPKDNCKKFYKEVLYPEDTINAYVNLITSS